MADRSHKHNIVPFNGEKYGVWKFRIRALLAELNVLSVIDEEIPENPSEEWSNKDATAKAKVVEHLTDSFIGFAQEGQTAKNIFQNLDALYERRSIATQLAVRKKLLNLKLKGDVTLIQHFTKFDELLAELISAGSTIDETEKISQLLLTLPESYESIITAIETLSSDENLTLAFVKTRLLDHEVKLKSEASTSTSSKLLHVETTSKFKHGRKQKWKNQNRRFSQQKFYRHHSKERFQNPQEKKDRVTINLTYQI